jgi:hypothetical protein
MLFRPVLLRLLPKYRRLMREGATAHAVVLSTRPWGWVTGSVHPNNRLTLRVHFDDGSTTTVDRVERTRNLGMDNEVGGTLPMRYDPADRSSVEIDCAALRKRHEAWKAKQDRAAVAAAEKELARRRRPTATTEAPPASGDDTDRRNADWIAGVIRLDLDRGSGAITPDEYARRRSRIVADLRTGRRPFGDGPDQRRLGIVAALVLGEPTGASAEEEDDARQGVRFLERTVRLKRQHDQGQIDDARFNSDAAALGAEIAAHERQTGEDPTAGQI